MFLTIGIVVALFAVAVVMLACKGATWGDIKESRMIKEYKEGKAAK